MKLEQISPFVRYAHFLDINQQLYYGESIPFDNRLFYLYSGNGDVKLDDGVIHMCEGDVLIIPSGMMYDKPESYDRKGVTYSFVNGEHRVGKLELNDNDSVYIGKDAIL